MPSMAFATGLLDGFYGTIQSERARKEKNALDMANMLISTGRVRDYNDLVSHIPQFQELFGGPQGKGGKGGKGAKGQADPQQIMGALLNPILKEGGRSEGMTQQGPPRRQQGVNPGDPGATASGVRPELQPGGSQAGPQGQPQGQPSKGPLLSDEELATRD